MTQFEPRLIAGVAKGIAVACCSAGLGLLLFLSLHRYLALWRWWRRRAPEPPPAQAPADWPPVTVQIPLYNERVVAVRLIEAAARLSYPLDRLQIQVLDDSTDETTGLAAAAIRRHRARGVDISLLRRREREGYKAGALATGLRCATGEFIAVLDADFVPWPDFLERTVPRFADPQVGMVQARWTHLNRDQSLLTSAQAVMLDAHFFVEHLMRMQSGLYFNFNGTAGVWRKQCIEESGGWSHDTLTEDLDLSYRAQLAGWRFVFDASTDVPAELPANMAAVKAQQHRWAKGSIQTARKLLPRILASRLPLRVKLESLVHLTSNAAYPLLLGLTLALLPVLPARAAASPGLLDWIQGAALACGLGPVVLFLAVGQRVAGLRGWRVVRDVSAALVLLSGLAVNNTRAVLEGLGPQLGQWERTPKTGQGGDRAAVRDYPRSRSPVGRVELVLAGTLMAMVLCAPHGEQLRVLPLVLLMIAGLAVVGAATALGGGERKLPGRFRG